MKCDHCGSDKTNLSHGKPYWKKYPEHFNKDPDLRICVKCSSYFRHHGEKHDEILSKQKARRDENKVTINKDRKIQYAANPESAKQRAKRRYAENPERVKEEHTKYLENLEKKDNSNRNHNKTRLQKRHLLMEILGGIKCSKCNFDNYSALQLHHNDDAGGKERSEFSESKKLTERVANPEKTKKELTVLCANCHRLIPIKKKISAKTFKNSSKN